MCTAFLFVLMATPGNHCPKMGSCVAGLLSAPQGGESFSCLSSPEQGIFCINKKRIISNRPAMLMPKRCGILCTSLPRPAKYEYGLANRTEWHLSAQLLRAEPSWLLPSAWKQRDEGSICRESCSSTLGAPEESRTLEELSLVGWSPQESCPGRLLLTI